MSIYPSRLFILGLCLSVYLGSACLWSQEDPFRAKVRFLNPITDTRDMFFMSQGEDHEIRATFNGPSRKYQFEGANSNMVLYRMSGQGENIQRTPIASIDLPAPDQDYLVFLLPDRLGAQERYLTRVYRDDTKKASRGNTRIHNLGNSPLAIKCGGEQVVIPAGESKTLDNRKAREGGDGGLLFKDRYAGTPIHMAVKNENEWRVVYSSIWHLTDSGMSQYFIIPERRNAVRVVQVSD